jgi:Rrf2 family protein
MSDVTTVRPPNEDASAARRQDLPVRVSAKTDYALRAAAELAAASNGGPHLLKAERIARAQAIPLKFLLNILNELRHEGIVRSQRGSDGGYRLARPAGSISLAEVIRAVEGPLSTVRDGPPREALYGGPATALRGVWVGIQDALERMLGGISLADLVDGSR